MSSGFVTASTAAAAEVPIPESPRTDAWSAAQAAVEASRKPKEEEPQDERTLYDILQANKARKQEEFEEKLKFKNQFKTLDEDDVDYLDSILKTEKAAEDARKEELESRLDDFRRQQTQADRSGDGGVGEEDSTTWVTAKKRRRKEASGKISGVKVRRRSSSTKEKVEEKEAENGREAQPVTGKERESEKSAGATSLVVYGSDED